ncbi:hypothetical protein BHE74_00013691 [Ensete ventricosum]|nr:hypothetical protein BHE74_00013691 [Ensete ventricosum]
MGTRHRASPPRLSPPSHIGVNPQAGPGTTRGSACAVDQQLVTKCCPGDAVGFACSRILMQGRAYPTAKERDEAYSYKLPNTGIEETWDPTGGWGPAAG